MQVVATAGHVDHGKSTLVRALTGMEPDRLDEERRRGLTIELGYVWMTLPSGERLAFVDVPGHERFLATTLAGVGPAPAVLFVVAADEGWMPQSEEHLVALDAFGVRDGVLAITRADLADPSAVRREALARVRSSSLGDVESVVVSGRTGAGLDALTSALDRLASRLPRPEPDDPVRLWVDRTFSVKGAGTVVTGTLPAGRITVGDELLLDQRPVRVRGLQTLMESADSVSGVARVAVNLRGRPDISRGSALVSIGRWTFTEEVDVRLRQPCRLPAQATAHLGSAAVSCRVRQLGDRILRLRLSRPLPLHVGDVVLLRDPGRSPGGLRVVAGVRVLDVRPPPLDRRGAARARAQQLSDAPDPLRLHSFLRTSELLAMGVDSPDAPVFGGWHAAAEHWSALPERLAGVVREYAARHPLEPGIPVEVARQRLDLPDQELIRALVRKPLAMIGGRIAFEDHVGLPDHVAGAIRQLHDDLAAARFASPTAERLHELGLGAKEVAAAVRVGALTTLGGVVLVPDAVERAAKILASLPQPFTVSQARRALDVSRRVAIPVLEYLDEHGYTERVDADHRLVKSAAPESAGR